MGDLFGRFNRPWIWILAGLSVVALASVFLFINAPRATGWFGTSGGSARDAQKLQAEISARIDRFAQEEAEIRAARLNAESRLNRIEGLLRAPRSPAEQLELGEQLHAEEERWVLLQEQAELFEHWASGPALAEVRAKLAAAKEAIDQGLESDAIETLQEARSATEPLLDLRATLEKMQEARQGYGQGKQQLDVLASTYRVAELPGSGELLGLEQSAREALERGEFEKSLADWQSAMHKLSTMKAGVFDAAIEKAKQTAADAIKAGDPAAARAALKRAKELSRELEASKSEEP